MSEVVETALNFAADDGFSLSGQFIAPRQPIAAALISSGTGFPKEFYRRFARAGAERGFACLIYDYRGIAASAPADLAQFDMRYADWGKLDMPAALEALAAAAPGVPIVHFGHSVGGHFAGFMRNHERIAGHVFVCVGTGTWWRHAPTNIPLEMLFWWGLGPLDLATSGHIRGGGLWGGTALPRGVFEDWRRWCHRADYFAADLEASLRPHFFEALSAPIRSIVYADDPIATPVAAEWMLGLYPNADRSLVVRAPAEHGLRRIGHAGAFRAASEPAWPALWDDAEALAGV